MSYTGMLDQLVTIARYDALQFAIAVARSDDSRSTLAAARLRWSLTAAQTLAERAIEIGRLGAAQAAAIATLTRRWDGAQRRYPLTCEAIEVALDRWGLCGRAGATGIDAARAALHDLDLTGMALTRIDVTAATLTDIDATAAQLGGAALATARLVRCRLRSAQLVFAGFDGATLDRCDLSFAALARTTWQRAAAIACAFDDAHLVDAALAGGLFVDCAFRCADFGVRASSPPALAALAGARFIRCDLRETSWRGRDLRGATFLDCAFHGAHGNPQAAGVVIESPDLSRAADGSHIADADDVVAGFRSVVGRPRA